MCCSLLFLSPMIIKRTYRLQSWLRILALGLFFVFSATLVNKALFQHSHLMPDGTVVVHAHPFERGDDSQTPENHHHDCFAMQGRPPPSLCC